MEVRDLQAILKVSGLSNKEKMEVAADIIICEALDTGIDAINELHIKITEVIKNCYK